MLLHRIIKGIIRLFTALILLLLGGFLLVLWGDANTFQNFIQWLQGHSWILALAGISFILISSVLFFILWQKTQKRVYTQTLGDYTVLIDETLFDSYLQRYWKTLFPEQSVSHHIVMKQNTMSIVAELPPTPEPERQALLDRINHELDGLFNSLIGYEGKITFSATFLDR